MQLQDSEVSGVLLVAAGYECTPCADNSMPHCILPEELDMLPFRLVRLQVRLNKRNDADIQHENDGGIVESG